MTSCRKKWRGLLARMMALLLVVSLVTPAGVASAEGAPADGGVAPVSSLEINLDGIVTGYKEKNNSAYTSLEIPQSVKGIEIVGIDDYAFDSAVYLEHIKLPNTLLNIGEGAFSFCESLEEITIPGKVDSVGVLAFQFCVNLKTVYILYGVHSIGDGAFMECSSLTTVDIAPSTKTLDGDTIFDGSDSVTVHANPDSAAGKYDGVKTTVLPDDSPSAYAYDVDPNTGEILIQGYFGTSKTPVVPDIINNGTVTAIGDGAFQDRPITQVNLPETLKTIGPNAFAGTNLTVVDIPDSVTGIGKGAFNDDASVVLKGSSDALDEYLAQTQFTQFEPWGPNRTLYHELTVLTSPSLAGAIQKGRSKEYKKNSVIDIEALPKLIDPSKGSYRFVGWTLSSNTSGEGNPDELATLIEAPNFSKTKLTMPAYDITLTANFELVPPEPLIIRKIGTTGTVLLYTGEANKAELAIENQWTYNDQTFSVDQIGYVGAFDGRSYNGEVFLDASLTKIDIPMSVEGITSNAFLRAVALQEIQVAEKNSRFCSVDGVLFDEQMTTLLAYPANKPGQSYTVPDGVTTIGKYAFYGNRNLRIIDLNDVKTIEDHAFWNASLTGVTMTDSLTSIGDSAFYGCSKLESATLPNSLTSLGSSAFYNCVKLERVTLPSSLPKIASSTFYGCSMLDSIVLPNSLTSLGSSAFYNCVNLKSVTLSESLVNMDSYAFSGCRSLTSITIPGSLSTMGTYAFNGCSSLGTVNWPDSCKISTIESYTFADCAFTEVNLPSGATKITSYAYARCNGLKTINISATITDLASNAFYGCNNLAAINVAEGNTAYASEDGVLFNAGKTRLMTYPIAKTLDGASYTVPGTVTTIGNSAFAYAKFEQIDFANTTVIENNAFESSKLQAIDLSKMTSVGTNAFTNCTSLTQITWPAAMTHVPNNTFYNCDKLTAVTLPEGVTSIGENAFNDCQLLTEVSLPTTLTSIGAYAFYSCPNLKGLNLPAALTSIGAYAYAYCTSLDHVVIPNSVTTIGNYAFRSCSNLTEAAIPATCTNLGSSAFMSCTKLKTLTVGSPSIPGACFSGCTALETLTLEHTVTNIGSSAFASCTNLKAVETGANIGDAAFSGCYALASLTLTDSVKTIGSNAFSGCNALTAVELPKSVTSIGSRAFSTCEKLESISVDADNTAYASEDGSLYNKDKTTLIFYPQNKAGTEYTTPLTVVTVNTGAFESANHLTTVSFTKNVERLEHTLFTGATKLAKVYAYSPETTFVRSNSTPAQTIFYGLSDSQLANLVVYGYLGSTAEDEVFASRIKGIKFMALDGATQGLVVRRIAKNPTQRTVDNQPLGQNTWFGEIVGYQVTPETVADKRVIVPSLIDTSTAGVLLQDESGQPLTLAEGESIIVSVVGTRAFWNPDAGSGDSSLNSFMQTITSVTLPQTITEIKSNAFEDCTALSSFTIPASVQEIRPYAFNNCSALTEITIPASVQMLGGSGIFDESSQTDTYVSAFYGCTNLKKIVVAPGNRTYADIDGVLTNLSKTVLYEAPNGFLGDGESGEAYHVPEGIETIGDSAFLGCRNLTNIYFPASLMHVGIHAFQDVLTRANSSITFAYNADAALDIDNEAFMGCTGLKTVTLPANLERIGDDVFKGCTAIENYCMDDTGSEQMFYVVDGVLYGYSKNSAGTENYALYKYPAGRDAESYQVNTAIPVRQIYKSAFQDNTALRAIALSDDVQIIQESAFRNCENLKSITWGASLWSIEGLAFSNTGLTEVELPAIIKDVGQNAFAYCKGLARATVHGKNTNFGSDVFIDAASGFTIYGYEGTTAQDYAEANHHNFAPLNVTSAVSYQVVVAIGMLDGTVRADKGSALPGETVTLTVEPDEGYRLVEGSLQYNGTALQADRLSFLMPEADVTITAEFEPIPAMDEIIVPEIPEDPAGPDVPTEDPATPVEPEDPAGDPAEPDVPTEDPAAPVEPEDPAGDPAEPDVPTEDPATPVDPENPAGDPAEPDVPAEDPIAPVTPEEPAGDSNESNSDIPVEEPAPTETLPTT